MTNQWWPHANTLAKIPGFVKSNVLLWVRVMLIGIVFNFSSIFIFVKVIGLVERRLAQQSPPTRYELVPWSIYFFKWFRNITLLVAAVESQMLYINHTDHFGSICAGLIMLIGGLCLRWLAIHQMGEMWSFKAVRFHDHYIVSDGLYRFIKHPAYIGNLWLPGLMLMLDAKIAFIVAMLGVIIFYFIRVTAETYILNEIREEGMWSSCDFIMAHHQRDIRKF